MVKNFFRRRRDFSSRLFRFYSSLWQQQHCASSPPSACFLFFELQEQLAGQPIHFLPLFLALTIYAIAPPSISTIIAITIIFSNISYPYAFAPSAYSAFNCFCFLMIITVNTATIASTNIQPTMGIQIEPKLTFVNNAPKKKVRKPMQ